MKIILCKQTALRFWCKADGALGSVSSYSSLCSAEGATGALTDRAAVVLASVFKAPGLSEEGALPLPLHVYVGPATSRAPAKEVVRHLLSRPMPPGAFRRIGEGVFVSSPELCFLEMADEMPFHQLVEWGFLLCGTYAAHAGPEGPRRRPALTTVRKIEAFIDAAGSCRGCAMARRALDCVIEGAASPREAHLAMLMSLPTKRGGYGFPRPLMNHRIDFSNGEKSLFGRAFVVLDLYWPQYKVALEYDGEAFHSTDQRLSSDRRKEGELALRGIAVLRVDKMQMRNSNQVYVIARKLAKLMGRQLPRPTRRQWLNRQRLFTDLLRNGLLGTGME